MIAIVFLLSLGISCLVGWFVPELPKISSMAACAFAGLLVYGCGVVSAVVFHLDEMNLFVEAAALERQVRDRIFFKRMEYITQRERKECGEKMIEVSKAVADRVATRILAKYVDGLTESRKREIVLQDVDEILKDELLAFSEAIRDEEKKASS